MSDNRRRYRARRSALRQGYPAAPPGQVVRHLPPLAALISGLVGSHRAPCPPMATPVPHGPQPESRAKRFARWLAHAAITAAVSLIPYAARLLRPLAWQTLGVVLDGSVVGRGCGALRMHVVYQGRALALGWQVRQGQKGPCPEARHMALGEQLYALLPTGARGVLVGDGEFAGPHLQQPGQAEHWSSVGRTGSHIPVAWDGERCRWETVAACSQPGTGVALRAVRVTAEA